MQILIIDDNNVARKIIEKSLTDLGYKEIDHAADSAQAKEKIISGAYKIVIIDWHMPGQSGYSLLQECREKRDFDDTAFIMITAQGYQESGLRQSLRSARGAVGIMQLLPTTAADPAVGIEGIETDAERNIQAVPNICGG